MSDSSGIRLIFSVVFGLVLFTGACVDPESAPDAPQAPVIIYLVDTLRADRLGTYGYTGRATSPYLDELAKKSVVFEQAYAPAPWTVPSVTAVMTSSYACENGIATIRQRLNASIIPLAERLEAINYYTGGFYNNPMVGDAIGLDRGYAEFVEGDDTSNEWSPQVREFLAKAGGDPFYLYIHTMEPHDAFWTPYAFIQPYGHVSVDEQGRIEAAMRRLNAASQADFLADKPPGSTEENDVIQAQAMAELEDHEENFRLLYDASVLWADKNVSDVVEVLKETGAWDRSIFIFMSDHGEEIGDHGGWYHGQSVYEELVRVPLIIHFPGDQFAGRRVETPVSLVDVMPTIFDYLDSAERCDGCRGKSLLPIIQRPENRHDEEPRILALRTNVAFYYRPWKERRGDLNVVVRQGSWKAIWNAELGSVELYDLVSDPRELADLSGENRALAANMEQAAREWLERCQKRERTPEVAPQLDEETRERMRALGYFD